MDALRSAFPDCWCDGDDAWYAGRRALFEAAIRLLAMGIMLTDEQVGAAIMSAAGESLTVEDTEIAEVLRFSAASALAAVTLISGCRDHA